MNKGHRFIIAILILVFLLRLPSLFEPSWYGDEGITLTVGQAWRAGSVLYRDIQDNKPPLLYLVAGIAQNLFWFKVILLGWMIMTVWLFWKLALMNGRGAFISTSLFAILTSIPFLEGNIANGEIFMLAPVIGGMTIVSSKFKVQSSKFKYFYFLFAGILFGVGFLFKHPAAMDLIAALLFLSYGIASSPALDGAGLLAMTLRLTVGFLLPIIGITTYFFLRGAGESFWQSVFINNLAYSTKWIPVASWGNTAAFGGQLSERLMVIVFLSGLLWLFRKKMPPHLLWVSIWFSWSLFGATLSGRPYPHYLLQVIPPLSLLCGWAINSLINRFSNTKQTLISALLAISLFLIVWARFGYWHYPIFSYYQNFWRLLTTPLSQKIYWQTFDPHVSQNYAIAEWLAHQTTSENKIFIWSDDAQIYALSHRLPATKYFTAYHIDDFNVYRFTAQQLQSSPPAVIITMEYETKVFPELKQFIKEYYKKETKIESANIYKLL